MSPTLANIQRIAQDLQKSLYQSFHLNFVDPLPRSLLEELAASVAQDGTGESVEQVRSHNFHFWTDLDTHLRSGRRPILIVYIAFAFSILSFASTASTSISQHSQSLNPFVNICDSQFSLLN